MSRLRKQFEENFIAEPVPTESGKKKRVRYVYVGLWYGWNIPPERLRREKRRIALLCACGAASFLAGGLMDLPLNYSGLIQLPAMLSLAAMVFEIFGVAQFCAAKEKLTVMDFHDIDVKLRASTLIHAALLVITALSGAVRLIAGGYEWRNAAIPLFYCISAAAALLIYRQYRALPCRKQRNDAARKSGG